MEALIGPAIVAAAIAALISVAGWYVSYWTTIQTDRRRRREKVRDFQIALRAEIRSELNDLQTYDIDEQFAVVEGRYQSIANYSVMVPSPAIHAIYRNLVADIHLLPETVIDPIVLYYRQRDTIEKLVDNMRGLEFRDRDPVQLWKCTRITCF